jgi:hypothetical protein
MILDISKDKRLLCAIEDYSPNSFTGRFIIFFYCLLNYPPMWLGSFLRAILPFSWRVLDDSGFCPFSRRLYIQQKGDEGYDKPRIRASIAAPSMSFGLTFHQGGEDSEIGFFLRLGFFSVAFAIENFFKSGHDWDSFQYGFSFYSDTLMLYWNTGDNDRPNCFQYLDFFLGSADYDSENVAQSFDPVSIPGDPAIYPVTIAVHRDTWKRPRSPFTQVVYRAHCEFPGGIPSGYKWGAPDATFASTFPADTIGSAVKHIQESILRDRAKEGWEPLKSSVTELIDLQVS